MVPLRLSYAETADAEHAMGVDYFEKLFYDI